MSRDVSRDVSAYFARFDDMGGVVLTEHPTVDPDSAIARATGWRRTARAAVDELHARATRDEAACERMLARSRTRLANVTTYRATLNATDHPKETT